MTIAPEINDGFQAYYEEMSAKLKPDAHDSHSAAVVVLICYLATFADR